MARVNRYRVVVYGASSDNPGLKAKIELYDFGRQTAASVGKIRFHEGALPDDDERKGERVMNAPAHMLPAVVDVLRNHEPIYFSFHEGRAVLGTGIEHVGTGDAPPAPPASDPEREAAKAAEAAGEAEAEARAAESSSDDSGS